jgi:lysophospholipase L1-like esterase
VPHYDVQNRGFSGYTTKCAIALLPYLFPVDFGHEIDLVTLFWGANDSSNGVYVDSIQQRFLFSFSLPFLLNSSLFIFFSLFRQQVPLSEYKENLTTVIEFFLNRFKAKVVVISPPPIDAPTWRRGMLGDHRVHNAVFQLVLTS